LVAGPIERSTTLLPQFRKDNTFDASRTVEGLKLIMWGFYKKLVLADTLAIYVEKVYETPDAHSGFAILLTSGFFGFQLYLDFSAYTDIAIGSARLLGYDLMSNFERPMQAKSLVEFWKRWHISMTSWFFDYLYKPLARFTRWNWRVNILLTFVIIGIWHGAGWGFVFFGLIHGVFYLLSEPIFGSGLLNRYPKKIRAIFHLQNAVKMFMVFMVNTFAVVFFRSDSIKDAFDMIRRSTIALFTLDLRLQNLKFENVDLLILFSGFALFYLIQNLKGFNSKMPFAGIPYLAFRWVIYFFILFSLIIFGTRSQEPFLYFQF
jgi:D-alanyl-lipoteichoic acid acyltransferase DltB (MBOAT superfamily)